MPYGITKPQSVNWDWCILYPQLNGNDAGVANASDNVSLVATFDSLFNSTPEVLYQNCNLCDVAKAQKQYQQFPYRCFVSKNENTLSFLYLDGKYLEIGSYCWPPILIMLAEKGTKRHYLHRKGPLDWLDCICPSTTHVLQDISAILHK